MTNSITITKAIKFIKDSFDNDGFLVNPKSNYRKKKAEAIIKEHGDELYERNYYNAALIIANPDSDI